MPWPHPARARASPQPAQPHTPAGMASRPQIARQQTHAWAVSQLADAWPHAPLSLNACDASMQPHTRHTTPPLHTLKHAKPASETRCGGVIANR
jgi:hypothetical protein